MAVNLNEASGPFFNLKQRHSLAPVAASFS
jgi:hypothetical protein